MPRPRTSRRARARAHHPDRSRLRGFGYFRRLGPGFVTGAADDDPAGIGTYAQIGASFRFDLVWTAPICFPLASAVQETPHLWGSQRDGGSWRRSRSGSPPPLMWLAVALVVSANTFNIGADLGAMAASFRLLVPVPFALLVIGMSATIVLLEVFVP